MLVIGISAALAVTRAEMYQIETHQTLTAIDASEIAQYNNAVRSWVAANPNAPSGTMRGVGWLYDSSTTDAACRTPDKRGVAKIPSGTIQYLPCSFKQTTTSWAMDYTTRIKNDVATGTISARTTMSPLTVNGEVSATLSAFAGMIASGTSSVVYTTKTDPVELNTFSQITYCTPANTFGICESGDNGLIVAKVSNSASTDSHLRVDGSNDMLAELDFGQIPASMRVIRKVKNIFPSIGETIYIGENFSGADGVAGTSDDDFDPELDYKNRRYNTKGGLPADPLYTQAEIDVVLGTNVAVRNHLVASNHIDTPAIFDLDDPDYFVNPDGRTRLSELAVDTIIGGGVDRENITMSSKKISFRTPSGAPTQMLSGKVDISELMIEPASGRNVSLKKLVGRYTTEGLWIVRSGQYVPKPSCGTGGTPRIIIGTQAFDAGGESYPDHWKDPSPRVGVKWRIYVDAGWNVFFQTSHNGTMRNDSQGYGTATTYCYY